VAVCHEVTESVVARVERLGVDLLVTYHPLLFRPTGRITAERSPAGRAYRLIRSHTSLAVAHTNFDVASGGVADALADSLRLSDTSGFGPVDPVASIKVVTFAPAASADLVADAMTGAGGGTIGNYTSCSFRSEGIGTFFAGDGAAPATGSVGMLNRESETRIEMTVAATRRDAVLRALLAAHPYEEPAFDIYPLAANLGLAGRVGNLPAPVALGGLVDQIGRTLGDPGLRFYGDPVRSVARIAAVPGSGSSYIRAAAATGADVLVTGDVAHHRMVEAADAGLAVIDPGHLATEGPGMRRLYDLVAGIVPGTIDLRYPTVGKAADE
jgi:dinuclear metal center YbgI/SA1388 family protein